MTLRCFWDRFGCLWELVEPGRLRLIWDPDMHGTEEGWTNLTASVPAWQVERIGYGPLVASA